METFWRRRTGGQRKSKSVWHLRRREAGIFEGNSITVSCCYREKSGWEAGRRDVAFAAVFVHLPLFANSCLSCQLSRAAGCVRLPIVACICVRRHGDVTHDDTRPNYLAMTSLSDVNENPRTDTSLRRYLAESATAWIRT